MHDDDDHSNGFDLGSIDEGSSEEIEGLERFKAKLAPHDWEPIYAISNEERFSPRTLYAVTAAFTGGSPVIAVLKGMGRALRQEWEWLRHGRRV